MDSQAVIAAMELLRRFMPDGFILICDQAPIHTSEAIVRYWWDHPEIIVEPLPKYAPELDPEAGFAVPWQCQSGSGQCRPGRLA